MIKCLLCAHVINLTNTWRRSLQCVARVALAVIVLSASQGGREAREGIEGRWVNGWFVGTSLSQAGDAEHE